MGEKLTSEHVRTAKIAAMPAPLGEIHFALYNEVVWLYMKWNDFYSLFGSDAETVALLNQAAPVFFNHLQRALWEDILLHLCRLTDPPQSVGRNNLTLRRLPLIITEPALKTNVEALVGQARNKTDFARDWRNRRLAHKELPPLSGQTSVPLTPASRKDVEHALKAITEVMNCIERHYQNSDVEYSGVIEPPGGVDALLHYLKKGVLSQRHTDDNRR